MRIGDVCVREVVTIAADRPLVEAAKRLRTFHVGNLVVTDPGSTLPVPLGVLTDRDIVVGVVAQDVEHLDELAVADVLTDYELVTAHEDEPVATVIERMAAVAVRRMPVVDDRGVLVGIFTLDDALMHVAMMLDQLVGLVRRQPHEELRARP